MGVCRGGESGGERALGESAGARQDLADEPGEGRPGPMSLPTGSCAVLAWLQAPVLPGLQAPVLPGPRTRDPGPWTIDPGGRSPRAVGRAGAWAGPEECRRYSRSSISISNSKSKFGFGFGFESEFGQIRGFWEFEFLGVVSPLRSPEVSHLR
jgi:hypothetical protein